VISFIVPLFLRRHGPIQPLGDCIPHDPLFVPSREKIQLFGKQRHRLAIGAGKLGKICSPENALRAEGFDDPANLRMELWERVWLVDVAWKT
jgi:hypothetical protein